jgi:hypothetical protein
VDVEIIKHTTAPACLNFEMADLIPWMIKEESRVGPANKASFAPISMANRVFERSAERWLFKWAETWSSADGTGMLEPGPV